jgi:RNA polymerase sigma-70 factor (ECF subfamily)
VGGMTDVCEEEANGSLRMVTIPDLPEEFWQLVEQFRSELLNQALSLTGNLADAEDVVQETFCEAFRKRGELKSINWLGPWLRTANRSNALDRVRSKRRDSQRSSAKQQEAPDRVFTTGGFSLLEMREMVAKVVEKLPQKMRTAVVLCYWDHLTPEQIGDRMNVSSRTVRRILFEASELLFHHLEGYLPESSTSQSNPGASALSQESPHE